MDVHVEWDRGVGEGLGVGVIEWDRGGGGVRNRDGREKERERDMAAYD